MILRDGLRDRKCSLVDGKFLVEGRECEFPRLREIKGHKPRIYIGLFLMSFAGITAINLLVASLVPRGEDFTSHFIRFAAYTAGFACLYVPFRFLFNSAKHHSCWKTGDSMFHYLFVEEHEGEELHSELKNTVPFLKY